MIQFASAGWLSNSRGLSDWWWITPHAPATLDPDLPVDEKKPNPDLNSPIELIDGHNDIPDQFDVLIRRIRCAQAKGICRIVFHEPAGVLGVQHAGWSESRNGHQYEIFGGTDQSMNQFLGIPQWKQDYFRSDPAHPVYCYFLDQNNVQQSRLMTFVWPSFVAANCTTNPDQEPDKLSIEIYIGGGVGTQTCKLDTSPTVLNPDQGQLYTAHRVLSFIGWDPDNINSPIYAPLWSEPVVSYDYPLPIDPRRSDRMTVFWSEIKPWHDAGITTFWLDALSENSQANPRRWGGLELSHSPDLSAQHIRLGGETFPTIDPSAQVPDDCALANMRWLTNSQVTMDNFYINGQDNPNRTFKSAFQLSKSTTECNLLDNSNNLPLRWSELREARRRGFVVSLWWGEFNSEVEKIKRWYSIGDIQVADFDGNGIVNSTDFAMADAALHGSRDSLDPVVFAMGDFNGDGVIDPPGNYQTPGGDWQTFLSYYNTNQSAKRTYSFRD